MREITEQPENMTLAVTSEPDVAGPAGGRTVQFRYTDATGAGITQQADFAEGELKWISFAVKVKDGKVLLG